MSRGAPWLLLLAWTGLVLPWQRCHDECHDRLLPAVVPHTCHGGDCPGPGEETTHHDEVEPVWLLALPKVGAAPAVLPPASTADTAGPGPRLAPADVPPARSVPVRTRSSTVLLL